MQHIKRDSRTKQEFFYLTHRRMFKNHPFLQSKLSTSNLVPLANDPNRNWGGTDSPSFCTTFKTPRQMGQGLAAPLEAALVSGNEGLSNRLKSTSDVSPTIATSQISTSSPYYQKDSPRGGKAHILGRIG